MRGTRNSATHSLHGLKKAKTKYYEEKILRCGADVKKKMANSGLIF